jgi:CspA family cold shock protein
MSFRDQKITCAECGETFFFTVTEQRRLAEQGQPIEPPDLCRTCTQRIKYKGKLHGRIKWFSREKGYGFLVQADGSEIFVHRTGIPLTEEGSLPALEEDQEVLYEVIETSRGPQAVQVQLVSN